MNPKVSICIPSYNYAKYLPEAIQSALQQSYPDFELLVIDDCSNDDSQKVIKHFSEQDKRIRYLFNEKNIGMVNNWNLCLQEARGDYIKYLFADDAFISPDALGKMASILDSNENISLVASSRYIIDDNSKRTGLLSEYKREFTHSGTRIISDCLPEQKNKIGEPSAVLFRKKHIERGFDGKYKQIVDLEMWFYLLEQGDFAFIKEPLCAFRMHPGQQTNVNAINNAFIEDAYLLIQDYANKPYIAFSRLKREYMFYVPSYLTWKLYKKHKRISKQLALGRIAGHYDVFKFYIFFPFYKLYKFYKSIKNPLIRQLENITKHTFFKDISYSKCARN